MASDGRWEVVKTSKKAKSSPKETKKKQKDFIDSMPRLSHGRPVKESETLFSTLLDKESAKQVPTEEPEKPKSLSNGGASASRIPQPKKKNQDKSSKKPKHVSLDEAMQTVKLKEFYDVLENDKIKFPTNPTVWLMDMASYLNLKLDNVVEDDPVFHSKPCDYPMSHLPSAMEEQMIQCMKGCDLQTACQFLYIAVKAMLSDQLEGISTYGYRIAIQIIARHRPEVTLKILPTFIRLIRNNQNHHSKCLAIMWVAGQIGWRHLDTGIQVWREVMLPLLNMKSIAFYVVEYLEKLFKLSENRAIIQDGLEVNNFFVLFDLILDGHPPNLSDSLKRRLEGLLPLVRDATFGKDQVDNVKAYFASFLDRVRPENSIKLRDILLNYLMLCLIKDKTGACFNSWKHLYPKHLYQSNVLMEYIAEHKEVRKKLDEKKLNELLEQFEESNEKLAKRGGNKAMVPKCVQACQNLRTEIKTSPSRKTSGGSKLFSWRTLFWLLFVAAAIIVIRDVNRAGWQKSYTYQLLRDYHILCALEYSWMFIKDTLGVVWRFLEQYVPVYYAKVKTVLGPYVSQALIWGTNGMNYLLEVSQPAREWLKIQLGDLVTWVDKQLPWIWSFTWYYAGLVFGFILRTTIIAWNFISEYLFIAGAWLQDNVFYDSWSLDKVFQYMVEGVDYLQQCLQSFSKTLSGMIKNWPPFKAG